ncbi:2TM domain-containing protein [Maribacter sp. MJ134]|uniref:2TM domain-containing protein n=1 Tax=Maribacter sp. MJ134 TaxID=2496865 RepID=UPI0013DF1DB0|nr:2TM domain-containing protein [Maribacter sp. MJ134]
MENKGEKERLDKARLRVAKLKGFYTHLTIYLVINTALVLIKLIGNSYYGEAFIGPLWHFSTFATWIFWGIGLFFHGLKVFSNSSVFVKNWEQRQIEKYMAADKDKAERLR